MSQAERIAVARAAGMAVGRILKFFINLSGDLIIIAGCGCILYGLALWNVVITWIVAGIMLISIGAMIAIGKVNDANREIIKHQSENK